MVIVNQYTIMWNNRGRLELHYCASQKFLSELSALVWISKVYQNSHFCPIFTSIALTHTSVGAHYGPVSLTLYIIYWDDYYPGSFPMHLQQNMRATLDFELQWRGVNKVNNGWGIKSTISASKISNSLYLLEYSFNKA